ncbi:MAG: tetratricopeptide repeat protein [Candidatus Krumholzibacteria bacterium]|nr:tetratricopeptide repeat protein [Candidatus Krumholzibacteria bacterium]
MQKSKELGWYTLGHIPSLVGLDGVLAGGMNELSHIEELIIFEILDIDRSKVTDNDSYGEALMKTGRKDLAIESYERALALDPIILLTTCFP